MIDGSVEMYFYRCRSLTMFLYYLFSTTDKYLLLLLNFNLKALQFNQTFALDNILYYVFLDSRGIGKQLL